MGHQTTSEASKQIGLNRGENLVRKQTRATFVRPRLVGKQSGGREEWSINRNRKLNRPRCPTIGAVGFLEMVEARGGNRGKKGAKGKRSAQGLSSYYWGVLGPFCDREKVGRIKCSSGEFGGKKNVIEKKVGLHGGY